MHKNPFNAISLLFFLSIITFSPACFAQPTEDPDTIHSFQLRSNTFSIANGLADEQLPSQVIDLYFLRNLTMISIPIHSSETRILLDSNGATEDERVIRRWIKHRYYVNQNDQSKGFYYDSLHKGLTKEFFVDTFVKDRCSFGFELDLKNYIFKEETVHKNGDLLKKYALTEGLRGPDSVYYYYEISVHNPNFSLEKSMDLEKNRRLYRVVYICNSIQKEAKAKNEQSGFPRLVYKEMVPTKIQEQEDLQIVFKRFSKDVGFLK